MSMTTVVTALVDHTDRADEALEDRTAAMVGIVVADAAEAVTNTAMQVIMMITTTARITMATKNISSMLCSMAEAGAVEHVAAIATIPVVVRSEGESDPHSITLQPTVTMITTSSRGSLMLPRTPISRAVLSSCR